MSNYPSQSSERIPLGYASERGMSTVEFFNRVYAWMFVGLAVTALVGFGASNIPEIRAALANQGVMVVAALGAFALAWVAQSAAMRLSVPAGLALFIAYAAVMGVLISAIFVVYPMETLIGSFLVTGGVFGGMSIIGLFLKKDLSTIGQIASMAVIGVFLASIFNIFFASNALSWFITYAVLVLFIILTASKTQELKNLAYEHADNPALLARVAVVGSIMLYIAFINLFLSILRILGNKR